MTKNRVSIFVSLTILSTIGYLAYRSFNPSLLQGKSKETIATLVSVSAIKSGFKGRYVFKCNGKSVQSISGTSYKYVIGEKYSAFYDSLNCENLSIDWKRPVFLEHESTATTNGVINITTTIWDSHVKFEYEVDGKKYNQVQQMEDGFQVENPKITEGAKFKVEYWLENPQRSIMFFH